MLSFCLRAMPGFCLRAMPGFCLRAMPGFRLRAMPGSAVMGALPAGELIDRAVIPHHNHDLVLDEFVAGLRVNQKLRLAADGQ